MSELDNSGLPASGGQKDSRRTIRVEGGQLHAVVSAAEQELIKAEVPVYQRGGDLVRVVREKGITLRQVAGEGTGPLVIRLVDSYFLIDALTRCARFLLATKNDERLIDCPAKVANVYLSRAGSWNVPPLLSIVEVPILRSDGSMFTRSGYDRQTGLISDPGHTLFPAVAEHPTLDDARKAIDYLKRLVKDFPFVSGADRSAWLAAVLTGLIRPTLRSAPLTAIRAPKMASGKSLLADLVALIVTGRTASVMAQGKDEEEDRKRILALLREGTSVAVIDNVERDFSGAVMCSVLTLEVWRDRVLKKSETVTVPTTATTWLLTGNNVAFVGDIVTRVVPCDLDAKVEDPGARKFDFDPRAAVDEHRGKFVQAGLTVLRAYERAGRPDQSLSVFGRFEEWSDRVRSALVWVGEADPCETRERITAVDPVATSLRELLAAWHVVFRSEAVGVAKVLERAGSDDAQAKRLSTALAGATGHDVDASSALKVASYLRRHAGRPEGGLYFERAGLRQGTALWRVRTLDGRDGPGCPGDDEAEDGSVGYVGYEPLTAESELPPTASIGRSGTEVGGRVRDRNSGEGVATPRTPRATGRSRSSGEADRFTERVCDVLSAAPSDAPLVPVTVTAEDIDRWSRPE